jgi:uncharacterized membrane protein
LSAATFAQYRLNRHHRLFWIFKKKLDFFLVLVGFLLVFLGFLVIFFLHFSLVESFGLFLEKSFGLFLIDF